MREGILRGIDWNAIARAQREGALGAGAAAQTELQKRSLLTSLEAICAMEPDEAVIGVHPPSPS